MYRETSWLNTYNSTNSIDSDDDNDICMPAFAAGRCSSSLSVSNLTRSFPNDFNQQLEKWNIYDSNQRKKQIEFNDFNYDPVEEHESEHDENEKKKLSYCYLCSINAHEHKKTQPVPIHKRRYLRPYLNPIQLMKKYEQNKNDLKIKTKYKFLVQTATGTNTGTDTTIWFKLFGSEGIWEKTELKPKMGQKFESGSLISIDLEGPVIGDLKKIKIWHNGKSIKEAWYLDFIEITCYNQMQTWRFVCDQWLSVHRPPNFSNSVILTLDGNIFDNPKQRNFTEYFVLIKTSNHPLVGKDINCQFQFSGIKHASQVFNLLTPHKKLFDKNQLDCFLVMSVQDLGPPDKIKLAHNSRKIPHQWNIEFIKILYHREPNQFYVYKLEKWIDKNNRMNAIFNFHSKIPIVTKEGDKTGRMIYHISVITGSAKQAGTEAKVFIELKGSKGVTKSHRLHNRSGREFRSGQMDHFQIIDDDIGQIKAMRIWHDNSGNYPEWLLDTVLVRCMQTSITGHESEHDSDLIKQLENLRKKYKIRDMKLDLNDVIKPKKSEKRSKSADLAKRNRLAKNKLFNKHRSSSADSKIGSKEKSGKDSPSSNSQTDLSKSNDSINYKEILKKNLKKSLGSQELSRASPTPSILKTAASPRTRKHVKFNSQLTSSDATPKPTDKSPSPAPNQNVKQQQQQQQPSTTSNKIEMNIQWILSVEYNDSTSNQITNFDSIEDYDPTIKNIDSKLISYYDSKTNKLLKPAVPNEQLNDQKIDETKDNKAENVNLENMIYVFECKRWLARNMDDRKTERILKLTNILKTK